MRTQEEILERFNSVEDLFGTQKGDLINFMTFENAKTHLIEDYVEKVEKGVESWSISTDAKELILDYLPFAYGKAEDERGLSAIRSLLHFKTWIWLDDEVFYNEISESIENSTGYGISVLDRISEYYGYKRN